MKVKTGYHIGRAEDALDDLNPHGVIVLDESADIDWAEVERIYRAETKRMEADAKRKKDA